MADQSAPANPPRLPARRTLATGREILIRTVTQDDQAAIRDGFADLSDQSRFMRFLGARARLTEAELARLTDPADTNGTALGAVTCDGGDPVGLARFIRLEPDGETAEIALTVVDAFQGQRAGTLLLTALAHSAQSAGVTRFVALVHQENRAMLALLGRYDGVERAHLHPEVEITLPVASIIDLASDTGQH